MNQPVEGGEGGFSSLEPCRGGREEGKRPVRSRREALRRFLIGTKSAKPYGDGAIRVIIRSGQVHRFYSSYWRVRFPKHDWEELTASETAKYAVGGRS